MTFRKINELRNWSDNPRSIKPDRFQELKNRITEFGQIKPVIITPDGEVLGGNMRLKAMKELGIEDIWVSIVEPKTEAQKIKIALTDNEEMGFYEDKQLVDLIEKYKGEIELGNYSIHLGEPISLEDLLAKFGPEPDEDEAPEVSLDEPISKLGEVYQLGRHRVMCGDSTKIEDVERLMDGKKADMVFTDPPYGMDFQSNFREKTPQFEKIKNDDVVLDVSPVLFSIMNDNSAAYICTRWDLYPQWYQQIEKVFNIKNCVVWYKKGGGLGDLDNSYSPNHEFIIVAHKGKSELRGKRDADVWQLERDGFTTYEHPTQKPVALSAFAIEHHSDSQSLIVDLFLGSGSTLIACEQTNRTCYGMELDPKYVDVIRKRYSKLISPETWEDDWQTLTPITGK